MSPITGLAVATDASTELLEISAQANKPGETSLRPEALLVRDALVDRGLETPMIDNGLSEEQKRQ